MEQAIGVLQFVVIATAAFQDHIMFFFSGRCISSESALEFGYKYLFNIYFCI
jgi:hypothetical protein